MHTKRSLRHVRAFSLLEVIVALLLVLVAFAVLHQSRQQTRKLSAMTRARAAAVLLADSLLEEIREHPFGEPAPPGWDGPRQPLEVWVQGRSQPVALRQRVVCKTGAFVGRAADGPDRDEVTVTVEWNPDGKLELTVPVWRE